MRHLEMDQKLFFWLNEPTRKALETRITRLFCAFWLRHMLRRAVLLRPPKLHKRHYKRRRFRGTPVCPTPSGTKSRSMTLVYRIIKNDRGGHFLTWWRRPLVVADWSAPPKRKNSLRESCESDLWKSLEIAFARLSAWQLHRQNTRAT